MKTYKTVAVKTSEIPEHVHDTMFIKGEYYTVLYPHPTIEGWCQVKGRFQNRLGGSSVKEQGFSKVTCKEHLKLAKS